VRLTNANDKDQYKKSYPIAAAAVTIRLWLSMHLEQGDQYSAGSLKTDGLMSASVLQISMYQK
jgi:hypothetical protein